MVVNRCFEDLERRVGFKREWDFVPEVGKKRNERVKVSNGFLILAISPEGGLWWTLSTLQKY